MEKKLRKQQYKITKVRRVLRTSKDESDTYIVYKVKGPKDLVKFFVSRTDAESFVTKWTSRKIN